LEILLKSKKYKLIDNLIEIYFIDSNKIVKHLSLEKFVNHNTNDILNICFIITNISSVYSFNNIIEEFSRRIYYKLSDQLDFNLNKHEIIEFE